MKLSIITINYNDAIGLQRTLDSVRSQTFTDYEQIIVDGGSSDSSISILKDEVSKLTSPSEDGGAISAFGETYGKPTTSEKKDSKTASLLKQENLEHSWRYTSERLKIVSEKDRGVYDAQNKGIGMAEGEYYFFLNAGDVFCSENVLERIFVNKEQGVKNKEADIIYGNEPVVENGKRVGYCKGVENPTFLDLYNSCMKHQATFIRRELFEKYGLYDSSMKIAADWEWFFRVIAFHDDVTLQYVDVDVANFDNEGVSNRSPELCKMERQMVLDRYMSKRMQADYALLAKFQNIRYVQNYKILVTLQRVIGKIGKMLFK